MSTLKFDNQDHTKKMMFLDDPVGIARYDVLKYPFFDKLTDQQLGFFWRPEEIELARDSKDFRTLTAQEQHIFTSNLKRQIVLDTVQGRAPTTAFLPIASLPEIENWVVTWAFSETIHSRSYTHIIRNIYSNPSVVFDEISNIKEISDCARDISKYYDDLISFNNSVADRGYIDEQARYEHKKYLWLCLNAVNALEGIRFYTSFSCSWAFAELKKMEGNAKIIKLIARDENLHLAGTQNMLKILPKEDPDFTKIREESAPEVEQMFQDVINQEKVWAGYLFSNGSIIGLNEKLLCEYIDWIGAKRMNTIGVKHNIKVNANPLSWTQKWIAGLDVQVAPQEVQLSNYIIGGVKNDIDKDSFKGFSL
jgi:ribonucleoside-diphosphate reductase beta chain